jgi:predicted nucleic acid-binding protein
VGRRLAAVVAVQMPKMVNLTLDVDAGELEAIGLAQEIHADAILMDDRAGRNAAGGGRHDWPFGTSGGAWTH